MSDKRHSVVLFYVTGGSVKNCFAESLIGALAYDGAHNDLIADVRSSEGLYVADNRDRCVRRFMRYRLCDVCRTVVSNGDSQDQNRLLHCDACNRDVPNPAAPEWMWFIDTDISLMYYGLLDQLIECADPVERPIMSALYFGYMNNNNLVPVWYGREADGRIVHLKKFSSGVQRLGVVGMGCCVIHRSVFEKFGTRYADTGWLYFGHDLPPWVPKPDVWNDIAPFGEDNCFCHRCDQLGIPIHGNGSLVVQHRKERYEDLETFLATFPSREGTIQSDEKTVIARVRRQPREANVSAGGQGVVESNDTRLEPRDEAGRGLESGNGSVAIRGQQL